MRMVIGAVLVLFLAGCGSGVTQTTVGGTAREKCRDHGFADSGIDSLFILYAQDEENGVSKSLQLQGVPFACEDDSGCRNCAYAIIDEVYD